MPYFFTINYSQSEIVYFNFDFNEIVNSCLMYLFAFSNHNFIFNVLESAKENSYEASRVVVFYAFYIMFAVYLAVLFIAYFSTFQQTNEIFIDRPNETFFMYIGKGFYSLALITHIGMLYFASKVSMQNLFNGGNVFNKTMYLNNSIIFYM